MTTDDNADPAAGGAFGAPAPGDARRPRAVETPQDGGRPHDDAGRRDGAANEVDTGAATAHALDTPGGRLRAWLSMIFVDHGFFRYAYLNLHWIDRRALRSAQPAPHQFRRLARDGLRTVVNLRGGREFGSYALERAACDRYGLAYEEIRLRSREAPDLRTIEGVAALLERIEYPALFHCKSGADRSGLMAALYLVLLAGQSGEQAKRALSLRFGHFRQGRTGVLDAFMDAFDAAEREAAARGERLDFLEWASTHYDAGALNKAFRSKAWADWLIDGLLRRE